MALGIGAEPSDPRARHEILSVRVHESDELQQPEPRAVAHQRDAHVAMKVPTDFGRVRA